MERTQARNRANLEEKEGRAHLKSIISVNDRRAGRGEETELEIYED